MVAGCGSNKSAAPTYDTDNVTELTRRYCMDKSGYPKRDVQNWKFDEQAERERERNPPPMPIEAFNACMQEYWNEAEALRRALDPPAREAKKSAEVKVL